MFCFIFVKTQRHRWRWWSSSFECCNMLSYWPGLLSKAQSFYVISPYAVVEIILFLGWAPLFFSCFVCPAQGLLPLHSHHQSMFRDVFTLGSAPRALLALGTQTGRHSRLVNTRGKTSQPCRPWKMTHSILCQGQKNLKWAFSNKNIFLLISMLAGTPACLFTGLLCEMFSLIDFMPRGRYFELINRCMNFLQTWTVQVIKLHWTNIQTPAHKITLAGRNFPVPQPPKAVTFLLPPFSYHCSPFPATFFRWTYFCKLFYIHFNTLFWKCYYSLK